jgi:hypothetical protein
MTIVGIFIVMGIVAILVLALLWRRHRLHSVNPASAHPGRGIADEIATAIEDVATRFSDSSEGPRKFDGSADKNARSHK